MKYEEIPEPNSLDSMEGISHDIKIHQKTESSLEEHENQERKDYLKEKKNWIQFRIDKTLGTDDNLERLRNVGNMFRKDVYNYLYREMGGDLDLHIRSAKANVKASVDFVSNDPSDFHFLDGGGDLGHTLGQSLNQVSEITNSYQALIREGEVINLDKFSEGLKKICEYFGNICESLGAFDPAAIAYLSSYPDKYKGKIQTIVVRNGEAVLFPDFKRVSKEKREVNSRESFNNLLIEIKDDPLMSIDPEKELVEIVKIIMDDIDKKLNSLG